MGDYLLIFVFQAVVEFGIAYFSEHFGQELCGEVVCCSFIIFLGVYSAFRLDNE